jgi:hypothetical protein
VTKLKWLGKMSIIILINLDSNVQVVMRTGEYWENNGKPDDESLIEIVNRPGNVL